MGDLDRKRRNLMSLTLKLAQLNEVIEHAVGDNSPGDAAGRLDTLRSESDASDLTAMYGTFSTFSASRRRPTSSNA